VADSYYQSYKDRRQRRRDARKYETEPYYNYAYTSDIERYDYLTRKYGIEQPSYYLPRSKAGASIPAREEPAMAYEIGAKIHVSFSARITTTPGPKATQQVQETSGEYWTHSLYLGSRKVTGTPAPSRYQSDVGDIVQAEFDAEVTGSYPENDDLTTEVREILPGGLGLTHYLYLGSSKITRLPDEPAAPAAPKEETVPVLAARAEISRFFSGYEIGAKVRVSLTARVTRERSKYGTRSVTETNGNWRHFLYLGSNKVVPVASTGNKFFDGDIIQVEFDAEVTGLYRESEGFTTEVREILPEGGYGFTHYLYLNSSSVTRLPDESAAPATPKEKAVPVLAAARITPSATTIESADILKRIAELEDNRPAVEKITINRSSSGELFTYKNFATLTEAREYLDLRDYNLDRFTIQGGPVALSLDDQEELRELKELNDAGRTAFGSPQWITAGVKLYNDEFFTEEWARNKTVEQLGVSFYRLDEWPLSLIAWDDAVEQRLNDNYTRIAFGDQIFWGSDTVTTE
jgi:hypothetical protein